MDEHLENLNLVDLLSEKHKELRGEVMKLWLEKDGDYVTETESHMLGMLEIKSMTVAESARKISVSRQGAHKCARKLIDRGYIEMSAIEGNNRDKLISLTNKGKEYCSEMLIIKKQIEEDISKNMGYENMEMIKKNLTKNWIDT